MRLCGSRHFCVSGVQFRDVNSIGGLTLGKSTGVAYVSGCAVEIEGMKLVLKRVVGWARRTEAEKVMLRHRFQFIRYRALYLASHVFSLFPIPLVLILRICGSD